MIPVSICWSRWGIYMRSHLQGSSTLSRDVRMNLNYSIVRATHGWENNRVERLIKSKRRRGLWPIQIDESKLRDGWLFETINVRWRKEVDSMCGSATNLLTRKCAYLPLRRVAKLWMALPGFSQMKLCINRRKLSQPRCIEEIYRPKYQCPIERQTLPCKQLPMTSEFSAKYNLCATQRFWQLWQTPELRLRMKRAEEKWRADAFECQRRASVCLHTPFGLVKRWGGKRRATVIGNKSMYTNSGFRGGIKRHQTNWTYLLSGSDEFYFDKPTLILASNIEYLQLAMLLNGALWVVWNVQSKTRATVQDSCFWLQLMKWHDNVSTKQQIGWFHFEWQQHLRCTSCSNEAASFSFWFWRVNES